MKKIILITLLLFPSLIRAEEPHIIINEIAWMGTAVSANDEWLELYNPTGADIDLTGWTLMAVDGSPEINLAGTIQAGGYFLLERTDDDTIPNTTADLIYTGALANSGEHLKLADTSGILIDEINALTESGWPAGDNSTKQTMEKVSTIWQTSPQAGGTPKSANSTTTPEINEEALPQTDDANESNTTHAEEQSDSDDLKKQDIIINEVFPNPAGPDMNQEFIELKNISPSDVDLTNWRLTTAKQSFTLPSLKMTPGSIVIFYRSQTKLALNNEKEKITLSTQKNKIIDQVEYKTSSPQDQSYQRTIDLTLLWGPISPQAENLAQKEILPIANFSAPKEAEINEFIEFDASDSFDPQNRDLKFFWDFGDGRVATGVLARQIYTAAGTYQIALKVITADQASSTEKLKIKITGPKSETNTVTTTAPTTAPSLVSSEQSTEIPYIFISEFLPDPAGSDTDQEFIELFSNHPSPIDLGGWQLDDNDGGSKPHLIPAGTIIKPGQYLVFLRSQTKIALNNDQDAVRLFSPTGLMVDYVEYEDTKEGVSLVLDEQFNWQQTNTPTPEEINVLNQTTPTAEKTTTSSPQILGVANDQEKQEEITTKTNRRRYWVSGVAAFGMVLVGATIKLFKK